MTFTVAATYEDGKLLPERALPLKEHEKVEIVIHTTSPPPGDVPLSPSADARRAALQRLLSLGLPVADWEQMEEEITRGAVE
ncbi:MAG TPA: antitoxin AF2212-like protein [Gemmataceae bacterium]|nr:antitoxin AF2212-like protein [Gemmataceae bacterium]